MAVATILLEKVFWKLVCHFKVDLDISINNLIHVLCKHNHIFSGLQ